MVRSKVAYLKNIESKSEDLTRKKTGKRVYLNDAQTRDLMKKA